MSCANCGANRGDVDAITLLCGFCTALALRLIDAGIDPADPGLSAVRDWNTAVYARQDT